MTRNQTDDIINKIGAALERDTRVNLHRSPITVGVEDERVILEGGVDTIAEKRAAVDASMRVLQHDKQWNIDDRIEIKPVQSKEDLEIRDELVSMLGGESSFRDYNFITEVVGEAETVHNAGADAPELRVTIREGRITLSGRVQSLSHKRLAEVLTWWTNGCRFVDNRLEVEPPEEDTDDDITDMVRIILEKDPLVHADQLTVGTAGGVVVMSGSVATREEKKLAVLDAWYVPGVANVVDRIESRH